MDNRSIFRPHWVTTLAVGILALIGGFTLANGPAARAAMEKVGLLQAVPTIPETFNYQGYLRETDGSLTNGPKKITAKIYAAPTGGAAIHTDNFANVNVRDGLFNVVIGDATPLGTTFDQAPLYIGISVAEVGAQGTGTELIPRERIHGVPWAIRATKATNATTATMADTATTATTANTIAPGAITMNNYSINRIDKAGDGIQQLDYDLAAPNVACFLTKIYTAYDNQVPSCMLEKSTDNNSYLRVGQNNICSATCIQWGQ